MSATGTWALLPGPGEGALFAAAAAVPNAMQGVDLLFTASRTLLGGWLPQAALGGGLFFALALRLLGTRPALG